MKTELKIEQGYTLSYDVQLALRPMANMLLDEDIKFKILIMRPFIKNKNTGLPSRKHTTTHTDELSNYEM